MHVSYNFKVTAVFTGFSSSQTKTMPALQYTRINMLTVLVQLLFCTTVLASTYRVNEFYTDSDCTLKNWGLYETFVRMPRTDLKESFQDANCTANEGGYRKTVWKATVPLTAADIPQGHVGWFEYSGSCGTTVVGGKYIVLGACDTARIHYARAGKYSISTTDSTQIMYAYNCTSPVTSGPSYHTSFRTTCYDNKGIYFKGIVGGIGTVAPTTATSTTTTAASTTTTATATTTMACEKCDCCGDGTTCRDGHCYPTLLGAIEACKVARGKKWAWTCDSETQCASNANTRRLQRTPDWGVRWSQGWHTSKPAAHGSVLRNARRRPSSWNQPHRVGNQAPRGRSPGSHRGRKLF
jgi:hypothetical protein